jgi:voltage-gated sodium channel
MEAWPDILRIEQFGCATPGLGYPEEMMDMCTQPEAFPIMGPLYFIAFILMGTMVIMNLFIGVIINGMEESQEEEKEFERAERRLRKNRDMSMELDDMAVIVEKLTEQLNVIRSQSTLNESVLTQQEPLRAELLALRKENEALKQKLGAA